MTTYTYENATGPIGYNMTNDYMFRIILQENKVVLQGLICSLLHLQETDIRSVDVTNPIVLGETISEKDFYLDVNVNLNNDTILNLEMQMSNEGNWIDRALSYTCRNFTHIQKGSDYDTSLPSIHIGFLNYTLFPDYPEFYSTHMLLNIKNHHLFSSKIRIGVVDLNHTELATMEDMQYGLDKWVALFKSKTWEELKMIASETPELLAASESLYKYNHEEDIRLQCIAREEYRKKMNRIQHQLAEKDRIIENQSNTITEQTNTIATQAAYIKELQSQLASITVLQ